MKVIERKNPETEFSFKFSCNNCESVLEADAKDLIYVEGSGDQRDWDPAHLQVVCPVCGQHHRVSENQISSYLMQFAKKHTKNRKSDPYDC